ncbi:hypothetical protein Pyrfu_1461 [Pyrolobus fumarii 1A]|uniref:Rossmann fold nucleotide-binding protein n=1 Tax=Pyrolobus fumarii (strain DSM 11204 / 1A) TaxID=694429 RepID=G0EH95_PYRF1|nr:hypothetical protein [Pyrolobus fumarii]AEM39319.1 hypothetical protein Pyrfu_1461 [Pyrolobus fumarii 1A]
MRYLQVCIAAYSGEAGEDVARKVVQLVDALVESCSRRGVKLVGFLGGYRGLMRVAAARLIEHGVPVVLVIPRDYELVDEPDGAIIVRTGMDSKARSAVLVRSCDVVIVAGGASGTMLEALAAYGIGVPVVYLTGTGLPSDKLSEAYPNGVFDERIGRGVYYTRDPGEAGELACNLGLKSSPWRGSR